MVIDPTEKFVMVELERIKWFLGQLDLTIVESAGFTIQDAHEAVGKTINALKRKDKP